MRVRAPKWAAMKRYPAGQTHGLRILFLQKNTLMATVGIEGWSVRDTDGIPVSMSGT